MGDLFDGGTIFSLPPVYITREVTYEQFQEWVGNKNVPADSIRDAYHNISTGEERTEYMRVARILDTPQLPTSRTSRQGNGPPPRILERRMGGDEAPVNPKSPYPTMC